MEILREQAAIDYLGRARSCLFPETDNFGSIPLLAKLISLEQVFLERLMAKGQEGFPLPMADYGLPDLKAWRIDIGKTFNEVSVIKANRARGLESVLQEFANASTDGIDKTFDDLQKTLKSDEEMLKALSEFSDEEEEFLTQQWDSSRSFPFYTDRALPGLLLCKSDRTPFCERKGLTKRFNKQAFRPGFKYVDAGEGSKTGSFFMMIPFSTAREALGFRLIADSPLIDRSAIRYTNDDAAPDNDEPSIKYLDLAMVNSNGNTRIGQMEKSLQTLRGPLFRALYQTDYTGKYKVLDAFFDSLFELNQLIEETQSFTGEVLELKPISTEESLQVKTKLASQVAKIYNAVEDNELRKVLQIAAAEAMQHTRRETEAAKYRPDNQGFFGRFINRNQDKK